MILLGNTLSWYNSLFFFFLSSSDWFRCVQEWVLAKVVQKRREWQQLNPSWWWLSWQKKHKSVFNFTLISSGSAAQYIHLKTTFDPARASGLFVKQMFLGNMLDRFSAGINQQVSLNSDDLSASYQLIIWLGFFGVFFFGFLILQHGRHLQSTLMCVQNLWDDSDFLSRSGEED